MGHAIKRLTFMEKKLLKCEMWYTFKAEQDRPGIGERDVRAIGFLWDIQDEDNRFFCGARYLNSADGRLQQRWQIVKASEGSDAEWGEMVQSAPGEDPEDNGDKNSANFVFLKRGIDPQWLGKRYPNGDSDSYYNIPGGEQKLCYNETADKINWHYFALTVDLEKREYVEMQSVNKKFDLQGINATCVDPYPRINCLVNPVLWIEADTNRRVFLFVDSIINSNSFYNFVALLSNGNFLIAYADVGNSGYGTFVIYDDAGNCVTGPTVFARAISPYISAANLANGNFVIAYSDFGNAS